MSDTQWWYAKAGQRMGPIPLAELTNLIQSGTVQADTLVWTDGMLSWQTIHEVEALASIVELPPPLPERPSELKIEQTINTAVPDSPNPQTNNTSFTQSGVKSTSEKFSINSTDHIAQTATNESEVANPSVADGAIWNPVAIANWSILFTPVLGSYLQMLNWRALGERERAVRERNWNYVLLLFTFIVYSLFYLVSKPLGGMLYILLLLAWSITLGNVHRKYVKNKFGQNYVKRSWKNFLFVIGLAAIITLPMLVEDMRHQSIVESNAKYELGERAYKDKDFVIALEYFKALAEKGDARAQGYLAEMYGSGLGEAQNLPDALKWARKAEAQNDARGRNILGYMYYYGEGGLAKDPKKAVELYQKAAAQGSANAQYILGMMYERGEGMTKDLKKAVEYYQLAAAKGDANSQNNLGVMYAYGQGGLQKNPAKAIENFQLAVKQGNAQAQLNLGNMYYNGEGVTKSLKTAVDYYNQAAVQGDATAQYLLGVMHELGEGVTKDLNQAVEYYKQAAAQGDARAQYRLGVMYANGEGVTKNLMTAVEYYKSAANQDNAEAQNNLGLMYYNGEGGLPKDPKTAIELYQQAAAQGYGPAKEALERITVK